MKVKVLKSGSIVNLPNNETTQVLLESGAVEVYHEPPAPRQIGQAVWNITEGQLGSTYAISVRCPVCRRSDVVTDAVFIEQVSRYESRTKTVSPTSQFKFEHCGLTEFIPKDVLGRYLSLTQGGAPL